MRDRIDEVLGSCPREKPLYLKSTEWLFEKTNEELESLYSEFEQSFLDAQSICESMLGSPEWTDDNSREWIDKWYPEAWLLAAWRVKGNVFYLAAEHHDRETPIALVLNCRTMEQINELMA